MGSGERREGRGREERRGCKEVKRERKESEGRVERN